MTKKSPYRLLLVDDDPVYTTIMERAAQQSGIVLEAYPSLEDLDATGSLSRFDGAILDFDLGIAAASGIEIAGYFESIELEMPVILVSEGDPPPNEADWPATVSKFIHKSCGYQAIVWEAQRQAGFAAGASFPHNGYLG